MPTAWVEGLTQGREWKPIPKAKATSKATEEWLAERAGGEPCEHLRSAITRAALWFAENGRDGAHDYMRDLVWGLIRDARDGHRGISTALAATQRAFLAEVRDRRSLADAEGEWQRALDGAVAGVRADGVEPGEEDDCDLGLDAWRTTTEEPDTAELYKKLGTILTRSDLDALPDPEPLIEGMLTYRSAVLMVGATGTNKTFSALGMACSVATGRPWLGHRVALTGPVVYVVGEGAFGLKNRIAAWEEHNGTTVPPDRLLFLLRPASLTDRDFWRALTALVRERSARLVILDTFSSLAPDADETTEAATATRRLADLSADNDCTAILVHHTGWGPQDRARGGSQLESNVDEVLVLEKADPKDPNGPVSLTRKKVKEGPAGARIWVERTEVGSSAVLEKSLPPVEDEAKRGPNRNDIQIGLLAWVEEHPQETQAQILRAIQAEMRIGEKKAKTEFDALVRDGMLVQKTIERLENGRPRKRDVWEARSIRIQAPRGSTSE
ncbi:AAA family ATPase [Micromonospora avicenniae]|nr:AAA family ATPase [Micromonospora avicenniae]